MALEFLNDIYAFIYIPIALVAIALGFNRALKSEEEESDLLKIIGGLSGLFLVAITVVLSLNEYNTEAAVITNYSILLGILLGMSFIARPFKELPFAFVISVIAALGLLYFIMTSTGGGDEGVGVGSVPLEFILIGAMVVVIIIFLISFIWEQVLDLFLFALGWGPVILSLGLVLLVQAVTILVEFPNADGILWYLPG